MKRIPYLATAKIFLITGTVNSFPTKFPWFFRKRFSQDEGQITFVKAIGDAGVRPPLYRAISALDVLWLGDRNRIDESAFW